MHILICVSQCQPLTMQDWTDRCCLVSTDDCKHSLDARRFVAVVYLHHGTGLAITAVRKSICDPVLLILQVCYGCRADPYCGISTQVLMVPFCPEAKQICSAGHTVQSHSIRRACMC